MNLRGYSLLCALGVVLLAVRARAELTAYEPFDYSEIDSELVDQEGGAGFSGEWFPYTGAPIIEDWLVAEGSLSFPGLVTLGNRITSPVHQGDQWVGLLREFNDIPDETATKYMSFLVRPEGTLNSGSFGGAFGVLISGVGGDADFFAGKTDGSSDYMIEEFFDTATRASNVAAKSDVTSLMVVKAEFRPGPDTFTLYVNPTPGRPEPQNGVVKKDLDVGDAIGLAVAAAGAVSIDELRWGDTYLDVTPSILLGDFDDNGQLTAVDIDLLSAEVRGGTNSAKFDLNGDTLVDQSDRTIWVDDLKFTWFGDANLDGLFDSGDLVLVLASGTYELDVESGWATGDFNGDARTDTNDLVAALSGGGYENGPRAATAAVPEPSTLCLCLIGMVCVVRRRRSTSIRASAS